MVEFRPILVLAVACGGCGARVRTVPHEETELVDLHMLAPDLSPGTVIILVEDEGWRLPAAGPAVCMLCSTLPDATGLAGTGWWVPIPSWTPLCDGCGVEGFWLDDVDDSHPFIVHGTELTTDHIKALNAEGWTHAGRLRCPACAAEVATRLFEALAAEAEYTGMDPLFTLEVPRG